MRRALPLREKRGLFTSNDYHDLFNIEGLNLIIELTGSLDVVKSIVDAKPTSISFLDHFASLLPLGDFYRMWLRPSPLKKNSGIISHG
jgi:hypothetical protein